MVWTFCLFTNNYSKVDTLSHENKLIIIRISRKACSNYKYFTKINTDTKV